MTCPLCQLIKRINEKNIGKKHWTKKIGNLIFSGERYICEKEFDRGFIDIVRYLDDDFLFVNSVRNKNKERDVVVCIPLKHVDKKDLVKRTNSELLRKLNKAVIKFIESNYKGDNESVRVIENFGSLASIPKHAHKQIVYTKTKGLHLIYKPFNYK
ncbi:Uncharacterised protein [Candidatus Tiddalikarchaeum anstoanum]|nr:Uncharacterised protein [Candidatus Tiddalikarchaeum anstoanum]